MGAQPNGRGIGIVAFIIKEYYNVLDCMISSICPAYSGG